MELLGKRKWGQSKRRFKDVVREDMHWWTWQRKMQRTGDLNKWSDVVTPHRKTIKKSFLLRPVYFLPQHILVSLSLLCIFPYTKLSVTVKPLHNKSLAQLSPPLSLKLVHFTLLWEMLWFHLSTWSFIKLTSTASWLPLCGCYWSRISSMYEKICPRTILALIYCWSIFNLCLNPWC